MKCKRCGLGGQEYVCTYCGFGQVVGYATSTQGAVYEAGSAGGFGECGPLRAPCNYSHDHGAACSICDKPKEVEGQEVWTPEEYAKSLIPPNSPWWEAHRPPNARVPVGPLLYPVPVMLDALTMSETFHPPTECKHESWAPGDLDTLICMQEGCGAEVTRAEAAAAGYPGDKITTNQCRRALAARGEG